MLYLKPFKIRLKLYAITFWLLYFKSMRICALVFKICLLASVCVNIGGQVTYLSLLGCSVIIWEVWLVYISLGRWKLSKCHPCECQNGGFLSRTLHCDKRHSVNHYLWLVLILWLIGVTVQSWGRWTDMTSFSPSAVVFHV